MLNKPPQTAIILTANVFELMQVVPVLKDLGYVVRSARASRSSKMSPEQAWALQPWFPCAEEMWDISAIHEAML